MPLERHVWLRYTHGIGVVLTAIVCLLLTVHVILGLLLQTIRANLDLVICAVVAGEPFGLEAPNYRRFAYLRTRVRVGVNVIVVVYI